MLGLNDTWMMDEDDDELEVIRTDASTHRGKMIGKDRDPVFQVAAPT